MRRQSHPNDPGKSDEQRGRVKCLSHARVLLVMVDKPQSGELFGVPYNFERPSLKRLVSSYWEPGDGMARPVRVALGGLGLVFLGAGGALAIVAGTGAGSVRSLAAFPAGLGAVMLAMAVRG